MSEKFARWVIPGGVVPQQAELALRLLVDRAGLTGMERAA